MITATDAAGATVTDSFVIAVANTNAAPTVASAIAAVTNAEDAAYSLSVSGMSADVDAGDSLAYTIA